MVHDLRQRIGIHSQCTKLLTVCLHPLQPHPFNMRLLHSTFEMDGAVIQLWYTMHMQE